MANDTPTLQGGRATPWRALMRHGPMLAGCGLLLLAAAALVRKLWLAPAWPDGTDLSVYLNAAGAILGGDHPYDPNYYPYDPYGYPPLFAEVIALFRFVLGAGHAWLAWPVICAICLMAALYLIMRRVSWRAPLGWTALAAGVLMFGHIGRSDLYHGQPDFLLLLLLVVGLMQFRAGKTYSGALAWGAMIVVKPFLGAVVFFLMRRGRWRDAIATIGASAILFGVSFLLFAPRLIEAMTGWLAASRWYTSVPNVAKPANQTFYGLFHRLFVDTEHSTPWVNAPGLVPWLMLPILALVIAGIYFGVSSKEEAAAATAEESGARDMVELCIPLGLFFALGPLTEAPHLYLLLPAFYGAGVLLARRWRAGGAAKTRWTLAVAPWLALMTLFAIPVGLAIVSPYQWPELSGAAILVSGLNGYLALAGSLLAAYALRAERAKPGAKP